MNGGRVGRRLSGLLVLLLLVAVALSILISSYSQNGRQTSSQARPDQLSRVGVQPGSQRGRSEPALVYLPQLLQRQQALDAMPLTYGAMPATQPALAPDGATLFYVGTANSQSDLYSFGLASGSPANLIQSATAQEETPVVAPDGKTVAFASDRSGDWDIYLLDRASGAVRLGIGQPGSDELHPAFTPDGQHLLFSSNRAAANWDIYSATISSTVWVRLTSAVTAERFPTSSAAGSTIAFRRELSTSLSNTVNSEIYVMSPAGSFTERLTDHPGFDGYPVITPDGSGVVFVSDRSGRSALYSANVGGVVEPVLELPTGWQAQTPRLAADGRTLLFAAGVGDEQQIYTRPFLSPLAKVGERGWAGLAGSCDWEAGVLAYGWAKAAHATGDPSYRQWLLDWVDGCLQAGEPIDHVNDGLLGYAALLAYQANPATRYLTLAQQIADYLLQTAKRTTDGTLAHLNDDTVWDDTLVSVIPFLVEMGRVSHNSRYWDEAAQQLVNHAIHLQNTQSGLYHHAWQESTNALLGAVYWCRGNSWPMLAAVELLAVLPVDHPQRATILASFQRQAQALLPFQASDGLWPTVVDQPAFYHETSGSAMIAAALWAGIAEGWLDQPSFVTSAQRARFGLWRQVQATGTVNGVSAPTGPMRNAADYNVIPLSPFELYGQGALLLLGAASIH